jgi:hypothetical protein
MEKTSEEIPQALLRKKHVLCFFFFTNRGGADRVSVYIRDYVLLMLSQKCGDQLIFSAKRFSRSWFTDSELCTKKEA